MKIVNRVCLVLAAFMLAYITFTSISSAWGSGYFPQPLTTNDPNGNLGPEKMYQVACDLTDDYIRAGIPLFDNDDIIGIDDWTRGTYYVYYYYTQDLLDICLVMRSI